MDCCGTHENKMNKNTDNFQQVNEKKISWITIIVVLLIAGLLLFSLFG
ncbi:hypothetical protein J4405_01000 [Candidatus Woesearchaeota archaeon]|nr:hypothetical protein [Candidatus Woesearchaeota archaeon]